MSVEQPQEQYSTGIRWVFYLLSFFFTPIAGLVIFLILNGRPDAESKALGKRSLIITLVALVVWCLCYLIFLGGMFGLAVLTSS